jgi:hypothetical protein
MATFWLGLLVKFQGKSTSLLDSGSGMNKKVRIRDNIPDPQHWNQVLKLSGDLLFTKRNVKHV